MGFDDGQQDLIDLFGSVHAPKVELTLQNFSLKAQELAGKMSISGVQPKVSVCFDKRSGRIEAVPVNGEFLLKPQTQSFAHLPENEYLCMRIAGMMGIAVPSFGLIALADESLAYIVRRFDREGGRRIHQEDFCQILGKDDKYKGSVEEIGESLRRISAAPGLDVQLFFERVVFNFLIGNGDAHLKNYSITYQEDAGARLSPAYDLVCSKVVIPAEEESALTINGKKNKISRHDLMAVADHFQIPDKIVFKPFMGSKSVFLDSVKKARMPQEMRDMMAQVIEERFMRLGLE